jgi:hypothetical protein
MRLTFTTGTPHEWCAMAMWVEEILGTPSLVRSQASHRWHARGMWGIPVCSLLTSSQTASFTMENFFFQSCHTNPENKNEEYAKNTQFSSICTSIPKADKHTYQHRLHCLLYTRQLININPFYAYALCNQNTNYKFSISIKLTLKRVSTQDLLAPAGKIHHHQEL